MRLRLPSRPLPAIGLAVAVLVVAFLAAWAADAAVHADKVGRNVEVAGRSVGGFGEDDLRATLVDVAEDHRDTPVTVDTPGGPFETTAGEVGLAVDVEATAADALDARAGGGRLGRPFRWVGSFFDPVQVPLRFVADQAAVDEATAELSARNGVAPVEPTFAVTDGSVVLVGGSAGQVLDTVEVREELLARATEVQLAPVRIEVAPVETPPRHDDATVQALAAEANALTDEAIALTVENAEASTTLTPEVMRSWAVVEEGPDGELALGWDEATIEEDVNALLEGSGATVVQLSWNVDPAGVVSFAPGTPGTTCCAPDASARVVQAIESGASDATVTFEVVEPDHDPAWAESMAIREPIASFTTPHACCQNRVANIQRMADLVRGAVVEPGGTFSINDHVGQRTTAKGFLEDGVIYNGKLTRDVGGGVSQFATTLFNAAFFGGLEIDEYQMHTLYIDRYPYGREATLSYPAPDLRIRNTTPYGILIWPTYTDTSITVTLYSTPWVSGEQTGQVESPAGRCTRVTTTRTRTWLEDGRTETDQFHASYQPADGVLC
jgi:vancomycin resistance protein YoaR